jgi:hypothetical protein
MIRGKGDRVMDIDHGPAVHKRCRGSKNPDFDYPERFGDRVPKTVRTKRRVTADFPICLSKPDCVAECDSVYPAWTNSHGAVSAILPNGEKLGLYPREFEVVEWLDLDHAKETET